MREKLENYNELPIEAPVHQMFGITDERKKELVNLMLTDAKSMTARYPNIAVNIWNNENITDVEAVYLIHELGQSTAIKNAMLTALFSGEKIR